MKKSEQEADVRVRRPDPLSPAWTVVLALLLLAGCPGDDGGEPPENGVDDPCDGPPSTTASADRVSFEWAGCASVSFTPAVIGEGPLAVAFEVDDRRLLPTITAGDGVATFRGLVLSGTHTVDGDEPVRLWRQGYQSWSWAGVLETEEVALDADGVPAVGGDLADVTEEIPWTSWWVGLVGRHGRASLLVGALTARKTKFFTAFDGTSAYAVWGTRGETITLSAGESLALDPIRVDAGLDAHDLLTAYAAASAQHASPPVEPPPTPPPTGWATWYQFYDTITEEAVRANLVEAAALNDRDDLADLEVFQIDDGWQIRWGEWSAGDDFPSGMGPLADDIIAAGFTPGLWMAPFYVDRDTETYAQHPDWWVRDATGDEIVFTNQEGYQHVIVDATHPEAGPWMAQQIADQVAHGYTYLKLDFLYAGAQEGQRHTDVTGVQAYHTGMELLRQAAGDAWILACGAPLLPSLGHAQSYRTGADIAFHVLPDPNPGFLRWQARATAGRAWSSGIWWWIDPDNLILRDPFDDDWARGAVAAQAASGGPWLLGDDLPGLPALRLEWALDPGAVATRGAVSIPEDPLAHPSGFDPGPPAEAIVEDDRVPVRWRLGESHVVLLNLDAGDVETECPGGTELLTGASCDEGDPRTLPEGAGEIWRLP